MARVIRERLLVVALAGLFISHTHMSGASAEALAPDKCEPYKNVPCIQVGTFNIEWLGTSGLRKTESGDKQEIRTKADIERIAKLIAKDIDLDVAVLIEINTKSEQFSRLRSELQKRSYDVKAPRISKGQQLAYAFDTRDVQIVEDSLREVELSNVFEIEGCGRSHLRKPVEAQFRSGSFEFTVIGVHLKSQVKGKNHPSVVCSDRIRFEQAVELANELKRRMELDDREDIIVTGDFNATIEDPSISPLTDLSGWWFTTRDDRLDIQSGAISYLAEPFRSRIDHIMIAPGRTLEWVVRSSIVYKVPGGSEALDRYLDSVSDHAPVWTSFVTQ